MTDSKSDTEESRMRRVAEMMFMIDAIGEQNGKSGLREEEMCELRCDGKEATNRR